MVTRAIYKGLSDSIFQAVAKRTGTPKAALAISKLLAITRSAVSAKLRDLIPWKAHELRTIAEWLNIPVAALFGEPFNVPVKGDVAANPSPEVTYEITEMAEEYLEMPQDICAFTVRDDSMEPVARPGQRVLVDPHAKVQSGDLVVANIMTGEHEGAWLFKRYERQKVGKGVKAILVSVAPDYPPVIVPDHSVRLWKAVGLWLGKGA